MSNTLHRKRRQSKKAPRSVRMALAVGFGALIIIGVIYIIFWGFPSAKPNIAETPPPLVAQTDSVAAVEKPEYSESALHTKSGVGATEEDLDSALYRALAKIGAPKNKLRIRKGESLDGIGGNMVEITANISKAFPMAMANHIVQQSWRDAGGEIVDAIETRYGRQVIISAGVGGIVTRKVSLRRELSDEPLTGTVALIIDDFGDIPFEQVEGFLDLPITFTAAIIPFQKYTDESAVAISEKSIEIIVHMPMEPESYPKNDPGPKAVYVKLPPAEIRKRIREAIEEIPMAVGMNNHMGSCATANKAIMQIVGETLKDSGLFFIDSRTSPYTCAEKEIGALGIPVTCQNGNIDVENDTSAIARRFIELALSSRESEDGVLIVGHARPNTLIAINRVLRDLDKWGIEFIQASELLARRQKTD